MSKREKLNFEQIAAEVTESSIKDFINDNYLPYSYYVIYNRALISDDGLKPVNRRILHTMYEMGMMPNKPHTKAASIAGNTMSRYHPHGSQSIEDSLKRMAQPHAMRVPLIDPYGEVGTFTGDTGAAARYWEARLTPAAIELLKEVKQNAYEMTDNYDGTREEPVMLPVRWPNGVINGSQGIAVGYACNIFPHNPTEVMEAAITVLNDPEVSVDTLLEIMPGPDFPTGGELIGQEGVRDYYESGSGTFTIRGKYDLQPAARGTHVLTFYELPYQVSAEQVIRDIKKAKKLGNLKGVSDVRDLSDGFDGLRLQIRIKQGSNPIQVIKELFQRTPLEKKLSSNMTVLHDGLPQQIGMRDLLQQFIDFRKLVTANKLTHQQDTLKATIERLSGLIKVILDIDKAIEIIRASETTKDASEKLKKHFKINEEQAEYVLSMPLRRLTKSDKNELEQNIKAAKDELKEIELTLNNEENFNKYIEEELIDTAKVIQSDRLTQLNTLSADEIVKRDRELNKEIKNADKNADSVITVFTHKQVHRGSNGYVQERAQIPVLSTLRTKAQADILGFYKDGTAHRIKANFVPENLVSDVSMTGLDPAKVVGFGNYVNGKDEVGTLIVTKMGEVNIISGGYPRTNEFTAVKLIDGDEIIFVSQITEDMLDKKLFMVSADGYATSFNISEIRTSNSGAGTVRGMAAEDDVVGVSIISPATEDTDADIVTTTYTSVKVTKFSEIPERKRGSKGVQIHKRGKEDEIINAFASDTGVVAYKAGRAIRLPEANKRIDSGEKRDGSGFMLGYK